LASWDATRVESRGGEDPGRQLKNIPEHVVRAGVSAGLPAAIEAEAVWTWTGRRWLDDANAFRLGCHALEGDAVLGQGLQQLGDAGVVLLAVEGTETERHLLSPPTVADISAALRRVGAAAMVYLVPRDEGPGYALIVPFVAWALGLLHYVRYH